MRGEFAEVRNTGDVFTVLLVLLETTLEPVERRDAKVVHLASVRFTQRIQHEPER